MVPALIQPEAVVLKLSKLVITLIKDDLTALPVDAFVYYAREDLELGSGYGTAIQQRGGVAIKKELEAIGRVGMGQAVITGGRGDDAEAYHPRLRPEVFRAEPGVQVA